MASPTLRVTAISVLLLPVLAAAAPGMEPSRRELKASSAPTDSTGAPGARIPFDLSPPSKWIIDSMPAGLFLSGSDCNSNGFADNIDLSNGTSRDLDVDSTPDECEQDSSGNSRQTLFGVLDNPVSVGCRSCTDTLIASVIVPDRTIPPHLFVTSVSGEVQSAPLPMALPGSLASLRWIVWPGLARTRRRVPDGIYFLCARYGRRTFRQPILLQHHARSHEGP